MALQDLKIQSKPIKNIGGGNFDEDDTFDVFLEDDQEDNSVAEDTTEDGDSDNYGNVDSFEENDDSYQDSQQTQEEDDLEDEEDESTAEEDDESFEEEEDEDDVEITTRENDRIRSLVEAKKIRDQQIAAKDEENYNLRKQMIELRKATRNTTLSLLKENIEVLKKQMARAQEEGDHTLAVDLQTKLNQTQLDVSALENWKEQELPERKEQATQRTTADIEEAPLATQKWLRKNAWFQNPVSKEDAKRQREAIAYANILAEDGYSHDQEEFFKKIDKRLEQLGLAKQPAKSVQSKVKNKQNSSKEQNTNNAGRKTEKRKKISQTVQSASRSTQSKSLQTKSRTKITLTQEQQRIADVFGMSYQEYAKELLRGENAKKSGLRMTPLDV